MIEDVGICTQRRRYLKDRVLSHHGERQPLGQSKEKPANARQEFKMVETRIPKVTAIVLRESPDGTEMLL